MGIFSQLPRAGMCWAVFMEELHVTVLPGIAMETVMLGKEYRVSEEAWV